MGQVSGKEDTLFSKGFNHFKSTGYLTCQKRVPILPFFLTNLTIPLTTATYQEKCSVFNATDVTNDDFEFNHKKL